ncbi:MAG: UDP-N-acetylglucosamine 1-carboxyvinyltransferase [Oscillospiraceae bacterium]|jgi:UDP-N-acetylglucosamine 1-carboxyvinyltransferase|nr:UDP-N-acetylglucosamine 1-carboxyvinyltransferase [Oscillospiraceae bacterium]
MVEGANGPRWIIEGGRPLSGAVDIGGGKNPALAVIAASLLCDEQVTIENLPYIEDARVMLELLECLGTKVSRCGRSAVIDPRTVCRCAPRRDLAQALRASSYLLGALLGRWGQAETPYPGGCDIGDRALDQHIKGMRALGAAVTDQYGVIRAKARRGDRLVGAEIYLDMVTVGGTINLLLASCRAKGQTLLFNAAKEPHVVEVANFLNSMGARIKGAGTDVIRVTGVDSLHGTSYAIIPDQIETGTMMIAAAATDGDVTIRGCIPTHMEALSAKLLEMGVRVDDHDDVIRVRSTGIRRALTLKTQVYPGFPTDLQQPMTAMLCAARGVSLVTETIFDSRFKHLRELARMGAKAQVMDRVAVIEGVPELTGASLTATDLRAGAALVVAGLMARGATEILNPHYIDRGYEYFAEKLNALGARIIKEDSREGQAEAGA